MCPGAGSRREGQRSFGQKFVGNAYDKREGIALQLPEARRRMQAGEKPFFLYPLRIFQREAKAEGEKEKKAEAFSLDEQRIMVILNKR